MHVLFVHKNFPAQFGHIARHLVEHEGFACTFVTEREGPSVHGIERIQYRVRGGATRSNHFCSRTFENYIWHSHAVYETLKSRRDVQPDLIVGHSGFGTTLFLADLFDCPIVNYFEWYYHGRNSEMDFRPEFPGHELKVLRARARNATLLSDLQACSLGYSPTDWQRSRFPVDYQHKLTTIFDGIETDFWQPADMDSTGPVTIGNRTIPAETRVVTYVARGFESMRGFDIFMQVARRLCELDSNVVFVCVGSDRICYGGDEDFIDAPSFRHHVLAQDDYDTSRFIFTGMIPPAELKRWLQRSDLHIYLTVPFVLSWSCMNALACGCTVLASDTAPVREMILHGHNGLLAPFYDVDEFTRMAASVLRDPEAYRVLGEHAANRIRERYSLTSVLPRMFELFERAASGRTIPHAASPETAASGARPWPTSPPPVPQVQELTSLNPTHQALLERVLRDRPRNIWHIGAGTGRLTLKLLVADERVRVTATDRWNLDGRLPGTWQPAEMLDLLIASCFPWKDRVRIRPGWPRDRLEDSDLEVPDVVLIEDDHTLPLADYLWDVAERFPAARLIGDSGGRSGLLQSVERIAERCERRCVISGGVWCLEPGIPVTS